MATEHDRVRLQKIVSEMDGITREVAAKLIKFSHLRKEADLLLSVLKEDAEAR